MAHILRARRTSGGDAEASYRQAKELLLLAEELAEGIAAYSLAGVCAALGDEEQCSHWLGRALELDVLPDRADIVMDPEFAAVLDRPWFLEVLDSLPDPDEADLDEPGFRPGPGFPWQAD